MGSGHTDQQLPTGYQGSDRSFFNWIQKSPYLLNNQHPAKLPPYQVPRAVVFTKGHLSRPPGKLKKKPTWIQKFVETRPRWQYPLRLMIKRPHITPETPFVDESRGFSMPSARSRCTQKSSDNTATPKRRTHAPPTASNETTDRCLSQSSFHALARFALLFIVSFSSLFSFLPFSYNLFYSLASRLEVLIAS
ncbi:MAG: hypothetical protein J3R72DRAFT_192574 [Linnemannia gamsii]|nr:MAG: hypothetical protein J3R72DRAFT_192574 [Linnemannia gamsii]